MSAEFATNVLWIVWYVTWIAAVIWSARTKTQMKTDMTGIHRFLFSLGLVLLLVLPSGSGKPLFGLAFAGWFTERLWPMPDWAAWSLFALVAAGFGFCWWARGHLGRLWSGFVTLKEGHRVVDTGPYALVRHPIYSGVIFASLMTAVMRASVAALAGFVLIVIGLSMTARIEERFLREQLGAEAYDAYGRRVAMLVPLFR
ncbi:MAG TPA: isoprenylcysteine carboxylmethyltransferase family protein [Rhizomicrobium sp.]